MIRYTTIIKKFDEQGEKTGWTYIEVPLAIADKLNPGVRKSYRVKGKLDETPVEGMALIPMGEGNFIIPLKADMRKTLGKRKGDQLKISLLLDKKGYEINADFVACLEDDPDAYATFNSLVPSHQRYFSKWIESAKTQPTREKRIAQAVAALAKGWGFGEMIRAEKG